MAEPRIVCIKEEIGASDDKKDSDDPEAREKSEKQGESRENDSTDEDGDNMEDEEYDPMEDKDCEILVKEEITDLLNTGGCFVFMVW